MSGAPLTGRKVLAIFAGAFAVIIGANLALLFTATGTFPGLVVKNSYVASQGWDAKTAAQRALGWKAAVRHEAGTLRVAITGADGTPVRGLDVAAVIGRPASAQSDVTLTLTETMGDYGAAWTPPPGLWRVAIAASDGNGARFEAEAELTVRGSF
jgi:nitrogen fixation protein FixH